jgi:hypothetical protein
MARQQNTQQHLELPASALNDATEEEHSTRPLAGWTYSRKEDDVDPFSPEKL